MLIIFDLDDTLIDTSGAITPFKLKLCLKKLVQEGLPIVDFELAYQDLLALNAKSKKAKDAFYLFLEKRGTDPFFADSVLSEMSSPLPKDFLIPTTPFAKEILDLLRKQHKLALVTVGDPRFQAEKLEKAGIDRSIFSNIAVPEDSIKKRDYERLIKEFSTSPEDVLVCGDRVAIDLKPAFELGVQTVHMRWGRGKLTETPSWVSQSIDDLRQLMRIIKR